MTLGYLHISDLHLSHGPNQRPVDTFNQDVVTNSMIKTIEDLVAQGAVIDFIIITGDLAKSGKAVEYEVAEIFCEKLLKATGLTADRLFIVPGNHDVDRSDIKPVHIKRYYPFDTQDEVTEILTDPDTFNILMRKFSCFHEFAQKTMARCVYDGNKCCFITPLDIKKNGRTFRINLAGLNSALFAGYDGDDQQKLALSLLQVNQALENTDKTAFLSMAFFHHPFACFHPEDKVAKNKLMREMDLILTGHLHEPSNAFIRDAAGKAVVIGAGASYMTRESRNSFNLVAIDPETNLGRVQFYKYLYDHDRWKKDTDVNPDTDDGHFPFEIGTSAGEMAAAAKNKGESGSGPAHVNTTELCGPGAVAQGNGAVAAGAGGIAVGGNVTGNIIINSGRESIEPEFSSKKQDHTSQGKIHPNELRNAYLNRVLHGTGILTLEGIDPKAASNGAEAQLNLGAVYTALLTHETDHHENIKGIEHRSEARRISALEMLDKHQHLVLLGDPGGGKSTFVNFVAWCLAGEILGHKEANLDLLTQSLPKDDEDEEEGTSQSWQHGPLLPVRVILRDFVAAGLPDQEGSAVDLWHFLERELEKAALKDFFPHLKQELMEQGGVLLLDGLDEVPEARNRRSQIKHIVADFIATFRHCRVLVTSRTYAYQKQDWRIAGMKETVLAPFSKGQIRCFVDGWYTHIAGFRGINPEDAQGKAELLKRAIFSSTSLRGLAERPLLLTLMASLHSWRGGTLPEKREELYADTVELLLDWWESPKIVRNAQGDIKVMQPSLAEWLDVDREQVRRMLNEVAFKAHKNQPDLQGTADIPEKDLLSSLLSLSTNPDIKVKQLVTYISQRAGLLVPNGVGVYTFPHRTFQEYLAACYLTDNDYPDEIAKLARTDPDRWREVALLAGAKAARGSAFGIWALSDALCCHDPDDPESDIYNTWGAHLAGQALAETAILTNVSPVNRKKLDFVRTRLCGIIGGNQLTATERAIAGNTLAKLGDPRFREDAWYLPDEPMLGFVEIPEGAFLMGSDPGKDKDAEENEQPQHSIEMPGYYMARYPVTVAQFKAFVETTGYKPKDSDCLRGVSNHPVIWVTWYDAVAYCKWLTEMLEKWDHTPEPMASLMRDKGWRIRLTSEAEWEKAARGTDGIIYPWGNKLDTNRANYRETGIRGTSSVGGFPDGASPYGCLDMAGNVWEWTRSLWGKEWGKPDFKYKYDPKDGREDESADVLRVLRGGAFEYGSGYLRCACRNWSDPGSRFLSFGFRVVFAPVTSDL